MRRRFTGNEALSELANANPYHEPGQLLFSRSIGWPTAAGTAALRFMDIPALNVSKGDQLLLSVRNGSATEILTCDIGYKKPVRSYIRESQIPLTATSTNATDVLTTAQKHNLKVGDRVVFAEGTGDAALTIGAYYYVVDPLFLMTDYVFQVSATPGGAVATLDSDTDTVTFDYVESPVLSVATATGEADDNVFTCATNHGLTVGDAVVAKVTVTQVVAGTVYYVKSTPTAKTFTLASAVPGGTVLDVTADAVGVVFYLADEFFSLTSFTVPVAASPTTYAGRTGLKSQPIQGWALGSIPSQIRFGVGSDGTYNEFWAYVEIRRV